MRATAEDAAYRGTKMQTDTSAWIHVAPAPPHLGRVMQHTTQVDGAFQGACSVVRR